MAVGINIKSKPLDQVRDSVPVNSAAGGSLVRLNMNISKATRDDWKRAAIDLNTDVTAMVHAAMREYLERHLKA